MAIITPFRVARRTFLRDVGFFTVAVLLTLGILYDGNIHLWEALAMVGLYVVYVFVVGAGSWWEGRQEAKRQRMREVRGEYEQEDNLDITADGDVEWEPEGGISLPTSGASTPRSNRSSSRPPSPYSPASMPPYSAGISPPASPALVRHHSHTQSLHGGVPIRPSATPLALGHNRRRSRSVRPSLLGAIEFRDVVNSLSSDRSSAANVLAVFGGAHQHHHHGQELLEGDLDGYESAGLLEAGSPRLGFGGGSQAAGRRRALSQPSRPEGGLALGGGDDALADGVLRDAETRRQRQRIPLGSRRTTWTAPEDSEESEDERDGHGLIDLSSGVDNPWAGAQSPLKEPNSETQSVKRVPSILLTTDSGSDTVLAEGATPPPPDLHDSRPTTPQRHTQSPRKRHVLHAVTCALFPSLQSFGSKSIVGKVTALLCVPALLALNLTLPVVEEPSEDTSASYTAEKRSSQPLDPFSGSPGRPGDLAFGDDDDEDPIVRVGRKLRAQGMGQADSRSTSPTPPPRQSPPAGHDNSHSHHLQHVRAAAAEADTPSEAWAELSTPPVGTVAGQEGDYFPAVPEGDEGEATPIASLSRVQTIKAAPQTPPAPVRELSDEELEVQAQETVTRWLTALQCLLGPVFVVSALFADDLQWWYPLAALVVGLFCSFLAFRFFDNSRHPGRVSLCFLGFGIAMVWILMIVNEVVGVLQTLGHIFGISDAILGLTIFAMGNSLGDLVANATVARMGYPAMAIAACFGGPMLNILLGVGLSGTYLIGFGPSHGTPLRIDMTRTLLVSGVGLFAILMGTLIAVPLNGYRMSKRVGAVMIAAYAVVLATNVAVEVWL
ncbi:hypothetical protein Rhopal_000115-T1 [Rhodotorula paludigena]|uniref:Sodium/calcium exchanger membrane region domain-containing protein n=1 Tax=Rhodotorula paludigena TaxID=86838 RepID=A0AAV5G4F4_9BASI|nr:hypothetical protein Rhopal_000115-T1 [Rhodotorula paludigena]